MKNKYKKDIDIKNWIITIEDLKRIYDLFYKRIGDNYEYASLRASFESGHIIKVEKFEDFNTEIINHQKDADKLEEISFFFLNRQHDFSKELLFQLNLSLNLTGGYSSLSVSAEDMGGEMKDWVIGTFDDFNKIKKLFEADELHKNYLIQKKGGNISKNNLLFDPENKIEKEIIEQEKDKKIEKLSIVINGNHNFSNNGSIVSSTVKSESHKSFLKEIIITLFSIIGPVFVAYLVYKFGWK